MFGSQKYMFMYFLLSLKNTEYTLKVSNEQIKKNYSGFSVFIPLPSH